MRRTKYSRKLYELNDCDVRSMLWYKLKMACRLGVPTDIFEFFASAGIQANEYSQNEVSYFSHSHARDLTIPVDPQFPKRFQWQTTGRRRT